MRSRYTFEQIAAGLQHVITVQHFGNRCELGNPDKAAPSLEWLKFALYLFDPNDMTRDDWMPLTAAFKQSGWSLADEQTLLSIWLEWCAQYSGDDYGENMKLWDSIRNSEVGWSRFERLSMVKAYYLNNPDKPPNSEEIQNCLGDLVERVRDDHGEAYKPHVLIALADMKANDKPAYMTIRQKLKRAGVGITDLEKEIVNISPESTQSEPDHLALARQVTEQAGQGNLLATVAHTWRWRHDVGVWRPIPDRELKQEVQRNLEAQNAITRALVDAVTDILKSEIFSPGHAWNPVRDIINVKNGELVRNGVEWVLQAHNREHHCTTQIPVIYDPQADCPRFRQFLGEIFAGDTDGQEKAQAVLEMIGYSLCSHARFEKFIILVGRGANGKSVILEIIRMLVGAENAAAVQPSQFSNRFQRAHLHLKLTNIVTEIAEGAEIADAELKAITSGESITAEHKHAPPFDFTPFCTVWLGTNHMPHTRDFSDALFRRALIVPFNRVFTAGIDADPHLKDKLAEELPGIMNLALQAYGEVLKRGRFTEPQSCLDAKREWRLQADQAAQFIEERCVLQSDASIQSSIIYNAYQNWALNAGISRRLNQRNFTERLEKLGFKKGKGAQGIRMIYGVELRT